MGWYHQVGTSWGSWLGGNSSGGNYGGGVDTVIATIKKNQTFVLICGNYVMKK